MQKGPVGMSCDLLCSVVQCSGRNSQKIAKKPHKTNVVKGFNRLGVNGGHIVTLLYAVLDKTERHSD